MFSYLVSMLNNKIIKLVKTVSYITTKNEYI